MSLCFQKHHLPPCFLKNKIQCWPITQNHLQTMHNFSFIILPVYTYHLNQSILALFLITYPFSLWCKTVVWSQLCMLNSTCFLRVRSQLYASHPLVRNKLPHFSSLAGPCNSLTALSQSGLTFGFLFMYFSFCSFFIYFSLCWVSVAAWA